MIARENHILLNNYKRTPWRVSTIHGVMLVPQLAAYRYYTCSTAGCFRKSAKSAFTAPSTHTSFYIPQTILFQALLIRPTLSPEQHSSSRGESHESPNAGDSREFNRTFHIKLDQLPQLACGKPTHRRKAVVTCGVSHVFLWAHHWFWNAQSCAQTKKG